MQDGSPCLMQEGSSYFAAPCLFEHAVEYTGEVVACQFRLLIPEGVALPNKLESNTHAHITSVLSRLVLPSLEDCVHAESYVFGELKTKGTCSTYD